VTDGTLHPWWFDRLANRDRPSIRALLKHHATIQRLLNPRERLCGIGVDVRGNAGINVVTTERVVQLKRSRVLNEAARDRIHGTHLRVLPRGEYLVVIEGPGLFAPAFVDHADADRFAKVVDRYLVGTPPAPRDIPPLLPNYYLSILRATGKPDTPDNLTRLVRHVARALVQAGALPFFDQIGDEDARRRFLGWFGADRINGDVSPSLGDDIIDWLWVWHPGCHDALGGMVPRIHQTLTSPESFLWTCGDLIPHYVAT
jgi:hypothetical protein